jgi:hypothetical protein
MKDPIRLLDGPELSALERQLLESARNDRPGANASAILLSGLDLSWRGPDASSTEPLTGQEFPRVDPGMPSGIAPRMAAERTLEGVFGKGATWLWAGGGLGVGGLIVAAWVSATSSETPSVKICEAGRSCEGAQVVAAPQDKSADATLTLESAEPSRAPERELPKAAPLAPSSEKARVRTLPIEPPNSTSLTEEIAALEPARVALRSRDARSALSVLSKYSARFPKGALAPEAEAMRAQANGMLRSGVKPER